MITSGDLPAAELRVRELTAKIALRQSQSAAATFITSMHHELRSAAAIVVALKYDPLEVIERMSGPKVQAPIVETRPPSDEDVRAKLREFLALIPNDASVSSLKDLINEHV